MRSWACYRLTLAYAGEQNCMHCFTPLHEYANFLKNNDLLYVSQDMA